jgi:hypothetical protein
LSWRNQQPRLIPTTIAASTNWFTVFMSLQSAMNAGLSALATFPGSNAKPTTSQETPGGNAMLGSERPHSAVTSNFSSLWQASLAFACSDCEHDSCANSSVSAAHQATPHFRTYIRTILVAREPPE